MNKVGKTILLAGGAFVMACAFPACRKAPEGVIQPEEMAQLLADLNTAEAIVETRRRDFPSQKDRRAFKELIYEKHGVSGEQVDSSMAWYGRNLKMYIEVCDRTIEILEQRKIESGNRLAAANALAVSGDSVDVWPFPRFIHVSPRDATKSVTFDFTSDENWDKGDMYTWRLKLSNTSGLSGWGIVTEYDDGKSEILFSSFSGDGWHELTFFTDTLRSAARVYGYLTLPADAASDRFIDSISIVRKRFDASKYSMHYRQRKLDKLKGRLHPEISDSVSHKPEAEQ